MKRYASEILSFVLLGCGLVFVGTGTGWFDDTVVRLLWYVAAALPVAWPVMFEAGKALLRLDVFNEFMLMSLATVGAFILGEYPEGVAVMWLYTVGEKLQDGAVDRARDNIRALLDLRPETAVVRRDGCDVEVHPQDVAVGETLRVRPGERVPLDGTLVKGGPVDVDTSALTGESVPRLVEQGGSLLAGMIVLGRPVDVSVSRRYADSVLSKVLRLVEEAAGRKAPAERYMRKVARVYTPVVFAAALLLVTVPYLYSLLFPSFVYLPAEWLYRALVFLVIACPCALVISLPLSYFGAIGTASRRGILFKGGAYVDAMAQVDTVLFDKTGTLTRGSFAVSRVLPAKGVDATELLRWTAALEMDSKHPLAEAVKDAARLQVPDIPEAADIEERPGLGLVALVDHQPVAVGNRTLMVHEKVSDLPSGEPLEGSVIYCAVAGRYRGCLVLTDELKPETVSVLGSLRQLGVKRMEIVSGDRMEWVQAMGERLGTDRSTGGLLPAGKAEHLNALLHSGYHRLAFVGDGVNDAPVLALAPVGIAMGAMGSDLAIETADVVIQNDDLRKIPEAIRIGRFTRRLIHQNIIFTFAVKLLVMALSMVGLASLWAAVFADTGVALLAVANSLRVGRLMKSE